MSDETPTAPVPETALAVADQNTAVAVMDDDIDFSADSGAGFEDVDSSMVIIPFIRILQDLSPQTKKSRKEYIEGASPGFFWETASNTFYNGEDGVLIVPIHVKWKWIEWVPRDAGGGIVRRWEDASYKRMPGYQQAEKGTKYITPEGHEIIEYLDVYCILVTPDGFKAAVFSTKSTAIQAAKGMITMAHEVRVANPKTGKRFQPAIFYSTFRAKLKEQSNEQGTWYGLSFVRESDTVALTEGKDIYMAAKKLYDSVMAGEVGTNDAELDDSSDSSGPRPSVGPSSEEVGDTI